MIKEMIARAKELTSRMTKERAARFISAEFQAAAYESKGNVWATYRNEKGMSVTQVLAQV